MLTEDVLEPSSLRLTQRIQRAEAALLLGPGVLVYQQLFPHRWGFFALLFFVPDLTLLAYVGTALSRGRAAHIYNVAHSYILPTALLIAAWLLGVGTASAVALVWMAHISFDRMLGYGLKLQNGFHYTHLGIVGKRHGTTAF